MPNPSFAVPNRTKRRPHGAVFVFLCGHLLLLALACAGKADAAAYRVQIWTTDEGLPQNSVNAILQTRDGYLWFTTLDGLVRFDGVRFQIFDKSNTAGLNSNRFNSLYEDEQGDLWAGTDDGGLARYAGGTFATYDTRHGLPHNLVMGIGGDGAGHLLVATMGGLARRQGEQFVAETATLGRRYDANTHLSRNGTLWSPDARGLSRWQDTKLTSVALDNNLPGSGAYVLLEDREGGVWVGRGDSGGGGGGLERLEGGAWVAFTVRDGKPEHAASAMYQDSRGRIWLGTAGGGLSRFEGGRFSEQLPARGGDSENVTCIYEDREGTIWLGTRNRGLLRLSEQHVKAYTTQDGLPSNNAYPIVEDRAGNVWVGTWRGGLSRIRGGVVTDYTAALGRAARNVSAIHEDRAGRLWIGSISRIGYLEGEAFTDLSERIGLSGTPVRVIRQDRAGAVWIGTHKGLFKYSEGKPTLYAAREGLPDDNVTDILEDRQGRLWFATSGGLARLEGDQFISLTEREGLSSNRVRTLHETADGTLWIGTYDGGLNRLRDGRLTRYTTRDGLLNNGVFRILEDGQGNFWMSSNRGISRVSERQLDDFAAGRLNKLNPVAYGTQDGMLSAECNGNNQPAGWRTRDGKLWFPTQGGVAVIDPERVSTNPLTPPVVIESCLLDREPVASLQPLRIEPGRENLEISYTGLSFIKPERVQFKYRLDGVDKDWIDAGPRRTAYYSYLPPGTYTFTVLAANSDGVWNTEGASLRVVVVPPFYRTWWFLALATLAVAGLAILIYEMRLLQLKRAHAAQENFSRQLIASQEHERKRIAAELHDGLGQNLLVIKNRALLGLTAPGDVNSAVEQLDEISATASQAIEEVREIAHNLRPYQLDRLGLTKALEGIVRKVSASSPVKFSTEIDQIDGLFPKEAEINLYRIVQESLNNVVKHSGATEARLTIKRDAGSVRVTVEDDGRGFRLNPTADEAARRGFGLSGIAERARIIGGRQSVQSMPGQGTTVTLHIELSKNQHGN
ncbi:MAG: ligand-binding sensor domain-containing protein [Pyrinomonadaceae bacterium]